MRRRSWLRARCGRVQPGRSADQLEIVVAGVLMSGAVERKQ